MAAQPLLDRRTPRNPATPQPTLGAAPALLGVDPLAQMARDDREDWALLRLVVCVAVATVLMAVASSFPA